MCDGPAIGDERSLDGVVIDVACRHMMTPHTIIAASAVAHHYMRRERSPLSSEAAVRSVGGGALFGSRRLIVCSPSAAAGWGGAGGQAHACGLRQRPTAGRTAGATGAAAARDEGPSPMRSPR